MGRLSQLRENTEASGVVGLRQGNAGLRWTRDTRNALPECILSLRSVRLSEYLSPVACGWERCEKGHAVRKSSEPDIARARFSGRISKTSTAACIDVGTAQAAQAGGRLPSEAYPLSS